jgi:hypothetical protein
MLVEPLVDVEVNVPGVMAILVAPRCRPTQCAACTGVYACRIRRKGGNRRRRAFSRGRVRRGCAATRQSDTGKQNQNEDQRAKILS